MRIDCALGGPDVDEAVPDAEVPEELESDVPDNNDNKLLPDELFDELLASAEARSAKPLRLDCSA